MEGVEGRLYFLLVKAVKSQKIPSLPRRGLFVPLRGREIKALYGEVSQLI